MARHLILASYVVIIGLGCKAQAQIDSLLNDGAYEQFKYLLYDDLSNDDVISITSFLEDNYSRVMVDLNVEEVPQVTIKIWSDYENFAQDQEETLGQRYANSGGFVWWSGDNPEIRAVYDERFEGRREATASLLHEFSHVVSMVINPTIPNNPRWLWESVAVFEAGVYLRGFPRIDYIVSRDFPTLAELDLGLGDPNESRKVYQVGYVLMDYVVETWNRNAVIELIATNGDIPSALGISVSEFESGWYSFIEENYLKEEARFPL